MFFTSPPPTHIHTMKHQQVAKCKFKFLLNLFEPLILERWEENGEKAYQNVLFPR